VRRLAQIHLREQRLAEQITEGQYDESGSYVPEEDDDV